MQTLTYLYNIGTISFI